MAKNQDLHLFVNVGTEPQHRELGRTGRSGDLVFVWKDAAMPWPPWWLILLWIVMVPLGIRMLVNPVRSWSRPRREWAEDHPGDGYGSGWLAQTEFQAIFGLGLVGLCTVGWLFHAYDSAHKDPPSHPQPKTQTDSAGNIAVMPYFYTPTIKGVRVIWDTYGDSAECPFDHVKVEETPTRVMVTVYEAAGTSYHCNERSTLSGRWGDRPDTTRHTDVSLHDPLGDRRVVDGDGAILQPLAQPDRQ